MRFLGVAGFLLLTACPGPAGLDGTDGIDGEDGAAAGVVFVGERDGGALSLGSTTTAVYEDVPGADAEDGDGLLGSGIMLAGGLSFDADSPGIYEVDLNATWALSLSNETVIARFLLDCDGDGTIVAEQEVMHSLGNASSDAVQAHTPFTVTTFVEFDEAGAATCVLQSQLEVAGAGTGIIFHGIDGYTTGAAYFVEE